MMLKLTAGALLALASVPALASDVSYDQKNLPAWEQTAVGSSMAAPVRKPGDAQKSWSDVEQGSGGGSASAEPQGGQPSEDGAARTAWLEQIHGSP